MTDVAAVVEVDGHARVLGEVASPAGLRTAAHVQHALVPQAVDGRTRGTPPGPEVAIQYTVAA